MTTGNFELPVTFDLAATFAFAFTGALAAIRRGYDVVGLLVLALASGIGGGLIRDGFFIQKGVTPLLTTPAYLHVVAAAAVLGVLLGGHVRHFQRVIAVADALGLGAYAAFGVQKALGANLSVPAAILVGAVNAVGGGVLRDVLTREEPLIFKPGQFYALTALAGAVTFVFLSVQLGLSATHAAFGAIALTFVFRMLTILFNWRTEAVTVPKLLSPDSD